MCIWVWAEIPGSQAGLRLHTLNNNTKLIRLSPYAFAAHFVPKFSKESIFDKNLEWNHRFCNWGVYVWNDDSKILCLKKVWDIQKINSYNSYLSAKMIKIDKF